VACSRAKFTFNDDDGNNNNNNNNNSIYMQAVYVILKVRQIVQGVQKVSLNILLLC